MATTVAWVEPDTAPNTAQDMAVVMGKPPRRCRVKASTTSSNRLAVWPLVRISAAKINMGTAASTQLPTPLTIQVMAWSGPKKVSPVNIMNNVPTASGTIMGYPIISNTSMITARMINTATTPSFSSTHSKKPATHQRWPS